MWVGIRSIVFIIKFVDGFVYANKYRQIPEIVNEPAQPHQPISIVIRFVDDDIRSIVLTSDLNCPILCY